MLGYEGQIACYKNGQGYGFIEPFDLKRFKKNIFFHVYDLVDAEDENYLRAGAIVLFSVKNTKRGNQAIDVLIMKPYT